MSRRRRGGAFLGGQQFDPPPIRSAHRQLLDQTERVTVTVTEFRPLRWLRLAAGRIYFAWLARRARARIERGR